MKKVNFTDTTFIIPFANNDDPSRLRNLEICVKQLFEFLDTQVIVSMYEDDNLRSDITDISNLQVVQSPRLNNHFNRSYLFNRACKKIDTRGVVLHDADAIIPVVSHNQARHLILNQQADLVYPFANNVMYIPDEIVNEQGWPLSDTQLSSLNFNVEGDDYLFVGFSNYFSRQSLEEVGWLNENMPGWGFEDTEIFMRMLKLKKNVVRTDGLCYHLEHDRPNNYEETERHDANKREYNRIVTMNVDDLREEISSWDWIDK